MMLHSYRGFVEALNEKGFFLFGGNAGGLLRLGDLTAPGDWHTEDSGDPWEWRCTLVENRDGVYARLLNGLNFMVSWAWYPLFLAGYRTCESLQERHRDGLVSAPVWRMYEIFRENPVRARHELTPLFTKAEVEKGLRTLQEEMYITPSGQVQKLTAQLTPIGWPSMEYTRVDEWAQDALAAAAELTPREARRKILARALEISPQADEAALHKLFNG